MRRISAFILGAMMLCQTVLAAGPDEAVEGECGGLCLPIVMYHHISPKSKLWSDYTISVDEFESDMKYLRGLGYESITVEELLSWYEDGAGLPEKPMMITFDDGYESTLAYAVPLLEKYGFSAVVAVIGAVADQFTELPDHQLDYSYLSWEAIREMSESPVTEIQCHTFDMHRQSPRRGCGKMGGESTDGYRMALEEDFSLFKSRCEEYGVNLAPAFAFPFGFYCDETISTSRDFGFKVLFNCCERVNWLTGDPDELSSLGRYNRYHGVSPESFFSKWD